MKEEIEKKYLPVGTVVMLKGGTKRVMIIGFCAAEEQSKDMFDYSGCLYPEGVLSSRELCLFDHEQIKKVYHKGLVDDEEKEFKKTLEEFVENSKNEE